MKKAVKNIDGHKIEMPFDFKTYVFPAYQARYISDQLYEFLQERLPKSFDFSDDVLKDKNIKDVQSYKTKSFIPTPEEAMELGNQFMKVTNPKPQATFSTPDGLPPAGQADSDGIAYYGEGIQPDSV